LTVIFIIFPQRPAHTAVSQQRYFISGIGIDAVSHFVGGYFPDCSALPPAAIQSRSSGGGSGSCKFQEIAAAYFFALFPYSKN
jgi:hypothetical protein